MTVVGKEMVVVRTAVHHDLDPDPDPGQGRKGSSSCENLRDGGDDHDQWSRDRGGVDEDKCGSHGKLLGVFLKRIHSRFGNARSDGSRPAAF